VWTSCGSAEATAVPFFGSALVVGLAAVGGVLAFARFRRRA